MLVTVVWKPKGTGAAAGLPDRHAAPGHGGSADRHTDVRGSKPQAGDAQEGALTKRAPARWQPSQSTDGDRSCSGGAPTRRAAASHPAAEQGDRWAGHAGRSQLSGRHLCPHKPGELAGDRGDDHVLGVLAGGQAPEAPAQPPLGGPGAGEDRRVQALVAFAELEPDPRGGAGRPRPTQASWARRWALPHLVMWPRRVEVPLEYSEGTRPQTPVNAAARPNRRQSHTSPAKVNAPSRVRPR
jgi:hypothetical protein